MATCLCSNYSSNLPLQASTMLDGGHADQICVAQQNGFKSKVDFDVSSKDSSRTASLSRSSTRTNMSELSSEAESSMSESMTSLSTDSCSEASNAHYEPLISPALVKHEIVASNRSRKVISNARLEASEIIAGRDNRLLVVVGPCSIHNTAEALEYARLLQSKLETWPNLMIIMRSYFEKPRTTVGWKGLVNDPNIDGSFQINKGIRVARQLLCDITDIGVPVCLELLDTISPQYLSDLVSWAAIGARTTECQLHREMASGCTFPIGFKNSTDGSLNIAIDAMKAASHPHVFMGVTSQGLAAIVRTKGNNDLHVILRGGSKGPNYSAEHVQAACTAVKKARPDAQPSIMVDCSHGNSQKNHLNQPKVSSCVAQQISAGDTSITGVMIESNLNGGRQDVPAEGARALKPGVSITDACVDWEMTVAMLDELNEAVGRRRKFRSA